MDNAELFQVEFVNEIIGKFFFFFFFQEIKFYLNLKNTKRKDWKTENLN